MRTVCPSCQAAYDVPDAVLSARRTLRCTRCSTDFIAVADGPPPAPARAMPAATPAPLFPKPIPPEPVGRRPGDAVYLATPPAPSRPLAAMPPALLGGWVASFILLGVMGWAFVAWRGPIMQAWPASERLYALLRLN